LFAARLVDAPSKYNYTHSYNVSSLKACRKDLIENLEALEKLLYISKEGQDLPVAFASNALYVLERNNATNLRKEYERILLPILREKVDYLHAEGVSQTVWALASAEIWDSEIWSSLNKLIPTKDFNVTFVKNQRWSTNYY